MFKNFRNQKTAVVTKLRLGDSVIDFRKTDKNTLRLRVASFSENTKSFLINGPFLTRVASVSLVNRIMIQVAKRESTEFKVLPYYCVTELSKGAPVIAEYSHFNSLIVPEQWRIMDDLNIADVVTPYHEVGDFELSEKDFNSFPIVDFIDCYHLEKIEKNFLDLCPILCVDEDLMSSQQFSANVKKINDLERTARTPELYQELFPKEIFYYTIKVITEPGFFYQDILEMNETSIKDPTDFRKFRDLIDLFSNGEIRFITRDNLVETFKAVIMEIERL